MPAPKKAAPKRAAKKPAAKKATAARKPPAKKRRNTPAKKLPLTARLSEVMAAIRNVEKDATNDFHNYEYASVEAIYKAVQPELVKAGIVYEVGVTDVEWDDVSVKNGSERGCTLRLVITLRSTDNPTDVLHDSWAGAGQDQAIDKAMSKAFTMAIKTYWRQRLLIPQGDTEPEDAAPAESPIEINQLPPESVGRLVDRLQELGITEDDELKKKLKLKLGSLGVEEVKSVNAGLAMLRPDQALELDNWLADLEGQAAAEKGD